MPDVAPPTLPTVENGDIPAPLSNLMRFVGIQVKKLQSDEAVNRGQATQKLHDEVTRRLQDILLDFGFGEEIVERVGDEFGGAVTEISSERLLEIEASIRLAYENCLGESSRNAENKNVILKKVNSRSDLRLIFNSLRTSADFGNLREKRVWMLPGLELKNVLEKTFCGNGLHWHKMILMALRFCEEEKTLSSYDLSVDGLRHFLCDYVFCVPREEFIGKPHTGRRPRAVRTVTIVEEKSSEGVDIQPGSPQPKTEYRAYLTTKQRALADFIYCFDGEKFHPNKRRRVGEYSAQKQVSIAAVYMLLSKIKKVLLSEKTPIVSKWGKDIPEVDDTALTKDELVLMTDTPETVEESQKLLPKKTSLAGVEIPDKLPDVSAVGDLPRAMREIFLSYYGYTAGDVTKPASYDVSKRMTREQIAQHRNINKLSVYQTLQKAMLRLQEAKKGADASPKIAKPHLIPSGRPAHLALPAIKIIPDYQSLIAWVRDPQQRNIRDVFESSLIRIRRQTESIEALNKKLLKTFPEGSLGYQILKLSQYLDPKKTYAEFVVDIGRPTILNAIQEPKKPTHPAIPPEIHDHDGLVLWLQKPEQARTVRFLRQGLIQAQKPKKRNKFGTFNAGILSYFQYDSLESRILQLVDFFGVETSYSRFIYTLGNSPSDIPEVKHPESPKSQMLVFEQYSDYLKWARIQPQMVKELQTFWVTFSRKNGYKLPGSLDIFGAFGRDSQLGKMLVQGAQLVGSMTEVGKIVLDILEIDLSVLNNPPQISKVEPPKKAPIVIASQVVTPETKVVILSPQQPKLTAESLAAYTVYFDFVAEMIDKEEIIGPLIEFVVEWKMTHGEHSYPGLAALKEKFGTDHIVFQTILHGIRLSGKSQVTPVIVDICDIGQKGLGTALVITSVDSRQADKSSEPAPQAEIVEPEKSLDDRYLEQLAKITENTEGMKQIVGICTLHQQGQYAEFVNAYKKFQETEAWSEIYDLREITNEIGVRDNSHGFREKKGIDILFELAQISFSQEDKELYSSYTEWSLRIGQLLQEQEISQQRIDEIIHESNDALYDALRTIFLQVPLSKKKGWAGYDEKNAHQISLYEFICSMVRLDHSGQKKYNGHVEAKEIRAKLRKIKFPEPEAE